MVRYPRDLAATLCAVVMSASALGHVQDRAVAGPPPGERAAIDAVVKGLSGTADGWEAIAKARFAPVDLHLNRGNEVIDSKKDVQRIECMDACT